MNIKSLFTFMTLILFLLVSCSDKTSTGPEIVGDYSGNGNDDAEGPKIAQGWTIPETEVFDGGPGLDGIPALTNPEMIDARSSEDYYHGEDLVIGIQIGNDARAYPHAILDWHEVINDRFDGTALTITYCPLTGSAIGLNRIIDGQLTTFGVSGLLYNSNLIPYDRLTRSYWSQMMTKGIKGLYADEPFELVAVVETTMKTWMEMYPDTKVNSTNTGYSRVYHYYPYGSYRTNENLIFPVNNNDARLTKKERVHGVAVDNRSIVFRINEFPAEITTVNHELSGVPIITAGSSLKNFAMSYNRTLVTGEVLTFSPVQDKLPVIMIDDTTGSKWDVFGRCVKGEYTGTRLELLKSYIAYWFAWAAFYPDPEIYSGF